MAGDGRLGQLDRDLHDADDDLADDLVLVGLPHNSCNYMSLILHVTEGPLTVSMSVCRSSLWLACSHDRSARASTTGAHLQ